MRPTPLDGHEGILGEGQWKRRTGIFLSSQSLSLFGSMVVQYAIMWHITLTTESGSVLTISTLVGFLPQIFISLFAGVWADRYNRKRLIIGADMLTASSTLVLALFFLAGYQELWLIFLVSGIRSVGAGIQMPAVNALLPQIVPGDKLIRINSLNSTIQPIIMILSPIIAGALMSYSSLEAMFFLDVVTAVLAVGLLLVLRVPAHQSSTQSLGTGYLEELRAGLAYIGQHHAIKRLFTFFAFTFFLITPVAFLSPLMVARSFGNEVWRLTANEITFFGGSILGGFLMTLWGGFPNRFRTIGFSCVVWGVLLTGLGISRDFNLYLFLMFLTGLPMPFFGASATTLLQEMALPEMHGRVFGVQSLITSTVMPVGMLLFGPASDIVMIEHLLVITGVLIAFPGLWIFFYRQPGAESAALELQTGD